VSGAGFPGSAASLGGVRRASHFPSRGSQPRPFQRRLGAPAAAEAYPILCYNCPFSSYGTPPLHFPRSGPKEYSKNGRKKVTLKHLWVISYAIVYLESQKGLEASSHRIMFRLPSVLGLSANNRSVRRIRASSSGSLARIFRNFGIDVDEGNAKVLDGPLSPSGEAL